MKRLNDNLLKRTSGWHIIIVIAISQIVGLLGAIPGFVSLQLITDFDKNSGRIFSFLVPILVIASQILILLISWWNTPNARNCLTAFGETANQPNKKIELAAWQEITNLTTRYGISAFIVNFFIVVIPPFIIAQTTEGNTSSLLQPTTIISPTPIYILLTGLASVLGSLILTLLLIERLTLPDRLALLPNDFEAQINGRTGALLEQKFQAMMLGLIIVGITVVTPIGYQQAIKILNGEVNSARVLGDIQAQTLLLGGLALFLGIIFSLMATRSISGPVNELITTLQKIEDGDLKQRVPVTGTDELAIVAMHFNRMVSRLDELQSTLEEQVAERTRQLTATNEVGRVASSILDPDDLLDKVVNLITEQFNYYYAAIYLLDPSKKWAELKEATGQAGNVLKQNRHRLEVSGNSMVAGCIRERTPHIAQEVADEKQRFENPLLPYTRSEIALPLIIGDRVLGALNVQSIKPSDFGVDVIKTMQNMAGQVAVALENARLFQDDQRSITELHAIQKQYLLEGWTTVRSYNDNLEYSIGESSDAANQVIESSISLRDQVLGQITLEQSNEWSPEQQSLIDAVTAQAAIALENARLVSESRQIALRERALADINSKIWASTSIEAILQTVVKELGKRFDTSSTTIELNMDDFS